LSWQKGGGRRGVQLTCIVYPKEGGRSLNLKNRNQYQNIVNREKKKKKKEGEKEGTEKGA